MNTLRRSFVALLTLLALATGSSYAGNTGKIVGKVTDKTTGEVLFGVNILVVGTQRGATTDLDGKFSIIGVPIGQYTLQARQIGYGEVQVSGVKVGADETTSQNFQLASSEVEVKGITITADAQMVNSQVTSGTQTVNSDAIANIPNVKSVEDVLKLQAGVVKKGNNIYVRGGRGNEVQYLVDGMPTNAILGNEGALASAGTGNASAALNALYAGVQSGAISSGTGGLGVSANAIQSVSVQTSGFDADYGNAQSGIVNIVTKSGGPEKYTGSVQFRTDRVGATNQNETYSSFSVGGPEPLTKYLLPQLGASIPGNLTFFFSADASRSDSPYNFEQNEFYNPVERKVELNGFLGGLLDGFGFKYRDNQKNSFTFNSKLRYDPSSTDQISYGYRASLKSEHGYNPAYRYRADSSAISANLSIQHNIGWTHFFSSGQSFLKVFLAKLENRDGNDVAGASPTQYSSAYQSTDVNGDGYADLSTDQRWYNAKSSVWSFRADYNSQIHELHLLKTGMEFNYEEIRSTEIFYPTAPQQLNGVLVYPPFPESVPGSTRGEYPGFGLTRYALNNYPNRGGAFLQDNIEFSGLNLHVGIRYDYFDIGKQVFADDFIQVWNQVTNPKNDPNPAIKGEWSEREKTTESGELGEFKRLNGGSSFLYYATHGNFSPRLSIGYPVTDRIVFYFNYGHFMQYAERDNYYKNSFDPTNGSRIGNPDLKPQRTVAYEAGFEDQFTDDMAFAIRAFYKDIFDYTTLVNLTADTRMMRNLDYASARGFETTFNQAFSGNLSLNLTYTYQLAKGRSSNSLASVLKPEFDLPRETRLDWDENHVVNFFATYRVGANEEGHFFGLPFINNYGISVTWDFGSGSPYSPYVPGRQSIQSQYLQNSETMPYHSLVNLSIYKGFKFFDNINLMATLDVTNLFNRKNVNSVRSETGEAPQFGDITPGEDVIVPWYQAETQLLSPLFFGYPRQILLGLKVNWD